MSRPHLSLSLSREMWNEILRAALPFPIGSGTFSLRGAAVTALDQLAVRERVAGLLEDQRAPEQLVRFGQRAVELWKDNRQAVFTRLDDLVQVHGTWNVGVDDLGTEIAYGQQQVHADAWVRGVAEGQVTFLRENVTLPFRIEKRVGASVGLGRIRYARDKDAVIGNVQDLAVHLGDHAVMQMLSRLIEYGVAQRIHTVEPVPVLKREQVAGLFSPLGGPLKLGMGVDDLQLDITGEQMTLHVRFGFTALPDNAQLGAEDPGAEP